MVGLIRRSSGAQHPQNTKKARLRGSCTPELKVARELHSRAFPESGGLLKHDHSRRGVHRSASGAQLPQNTKSCTTELKVAKELYSRAFPISEQPGWWSVAGVLREHSSLRTQRKQRCEGVVLPS